MMKLVLLCVLGLLLATANAQCEAVPPYSISEFLNTDTGNFNIDATALVGDTGTVFLVPADEANTDPSVYVYFLEGEAYGATVVADTNTVIIVKGDVPPPTGTPSSGTPTGTATGPTPTGDGPSPTGIVGATRLSGLQLPAAVLLALMAVFGQRGSFTTYIVIGAVVASASVAMAAFPDGDEASLCVAGQLNVKIEVSQKQHNQITITSPTDFLTVDNARDWVWTEDDQGCTGDVCTYVITNTLFGCSQACGNVNDETVASYTCENDSCVITCVDDALQDCLDNISGCETPKNDPQYCGSCSNDCTQLTIANGDAANAGCIEDPDNAGDYICDISTACTLGYADCNGDPADGCETPTTASPNCGVCGGDCSITDDPTSPAFNTNSSVCATDGSGCLTDGFCLDGWGDCDATQPGCETDLSSTDENCGVCGNNCLETGDPNIPAGTCVDGFCQYDCPAGTFSCAGSLCSTDVQTDSAHCGACDSPCDTAERVGLLTPTACAAGVCNPICDTASGFQDCNNDPLLDGCEVNVLSSADNCGACGNACNNANTNGLVECDAGVCVCPDAASIDECCIDTFYKTCGTDTCGTNTNIDVNNCGECDNVCTPANVVEPTCDTGSCSYNEAAADSVNGCVPGFADCNGDKTDGCEVDLSRTDNCGRCFVNCEVGLSVQTPTCVVDDADASNNFCAFGVVGGEPDTCIPGFKNCLEVNAGDDADLLAALGADLSGDISAFDWGCEANLASDATCGDCLAVAPPAEATAGVTRDCASFDGNAICTGGACVIQDCDGAALSLSCDAGLLANQPWIDCNTDGGAPTTCGSCTNDCTDDSVYPNVNTDAGSTGATCGAGVCNFQAENACAPGFIDCNGDPTDGCEVDGTLSCGSADFGVDGCPIALDGTYCDGSDGGAALTNVDTDALAAGVAAERAGLGLDPLVGPVPYCVRSSSGLASTSWGVCRGGAYCASPAADCNQDQSDGCETGNADLCNSDGAFSGQSSQCATAIGYGVYPSNFIDPALSIADRYKFDCLILKTAVADPTNPLLPFGGSIDYHLDAALANQADQDFCNAEGKCDFTCAADFADCNDHPADGCETDTTICGTTCNHVAIDNCGGYWYDFQEGVFPEDSGLIGGKTVCVDCTALTGLIPGAADAECFPISRYPDLVSYPDVTAVQSTDIATTLESTVPHRGFCRTDDLVCDSDLCRDEDGDWTNGCETAYSVEYTELLGTAINCGDIAWVAGDAVSQFGLVIPPYCDGDAASDFAGKCVLECMDNYVDCDGDPRNGCETEVTGNCGNEVGNILVACEFRADVKCGANTCDDCTVLPGTLLTDYGDPTNQNANSDPTQFNASPAASTCISSTDGARSLDEVFACDTTLHYLNPSWDFPNSLNGACQAELCHDLDGDVSNGCESAQLYGRGPYYWFGDNTILSAFGDPYIPNKYQDAADDYNNLKRRSGSASALSTDVIPWFDLVLGYETLAPKMTIFADMYAGSSQDCVLSEWSAWGDCTFRDDCSDFDYYAQTRIRTRAVLTPATFSGDCHLPLVEDWFRFTSMDQVYGDGLGVVVQIANADVTPEWFFSTRLEGIPGLTYFIPRTTDSRKAAYRDTLTLGTDQYLSAPRIEAENSLEVTWSIGEQQDLDKTRGCAPVDSCTLTGGEEPVNCVITEWGEWSACSATCDGEYSGSVRIRTREVISPAYFGGQCFQSDFINPETGRDLTSADLVPEGAGQLFQEDWGCNAESCASFNCDNGANMFGDNLAPRWADEESAAALHIDISNGNPTCDGRDWPLQYGFKYDEVNDSYRPYLLSEVFADPAYEFRWPGHCLYECAPVRDADSGLITAYFIDCNGDPRDGCETEEAKCSYDTFKGYLNTHDAYIIYQPSGAPDASDRNLENYGFSGVSRINRSPSAHPWGGCTLAWNENFEEVETNYVDCSADLFRDVKTKTLNWKSFDDYYAGSTSTVETSFGSCVPATGLCERECAKGFAHCGADIMSPKLLQNPNDNIIPADPRICVDIKLDHRCGSGCVNCNLLGTDVECVPTKDKTDWYCKVECDDGCTDHDKHWMNGCEVADYEAMPYLFEDPVDTQYSDWSEYTPCTYEDNCGYRWDCDLSTAPGAGKNYDCASPATFTRNVPVQMSYRQIAVQARNGGYDAGFEELGLKQNLRVDRAGKASAFTLGGATLDMTFPYVTVSNLFRTKLCKPASTCVECTNQLAGIEQDCVLTDWTAWGPCSADCYFEETRTLLEYVVEPLREVGIKSGSVLTAPLRDNGTPIQMRTRSVEVGAYNGGRCPPTGDTWQVSELAPLFNSRVPDLVETSYLVDIRECNVETCYYETDCDRLNVLYPGHFIGAHQWSVLGNVELFNDGVSPVISGWPMNGGDDNKVICIDGECDAYCDTLNGYTDCDADVRNGCEPYVYDHSCGNALGCGTPNIVGDLDIDIEAELLLFSGSAVNVSGFVQLQKWYHTFDLTDCSSLPGIMSSSSAPCTPQYWSTAGPQTALGVPATLGGASLPDAGVEAFQNAQKSVADLERDLTNHTETGARLMLNHPRLGIQTTRNFVRNAVIPGASIESDIGFVDHQCDLRWACDEYLCMNNNNVDWLSGQAWRDGCETAMNYRYPFVTYPLYGAGLKFDVDTEALAAGGGDVSVDDTYSGAVTVQGLNEAIFMRATPYYSSIGLLEEQLAEPFFNNRVTGEYTFCHIWAVSQAQGVDISGYKYLDGEVLCHSSTETVTRGSPTDPVNPVYAVTVNFDYTGYRGDLVYYPITTDPWAPVVYSYDEFDGAEGFIYEETLNETPYQKSYDATRNELRLYDSGTAPATDIAGVTDLSGDIIHALWFEATWWDSKPTGAVAESNIDIAVYDDSEADHQLGRIPQYDLYDLFFPQAEDGTTFPYHGLNPMYVGAGFAPVFDDANLEIVATDIAGISGRQSLMTRLASFVRGRRDTTDLPVRWSFDCSKGLDYCALPNIDGSSPYNNILDEVRSQIKAETQCHYRTNFDYGCIGDARITDRYEIVNQQLVLAVPNDPVVWQLDGDDNLVLDNGKPVNVGDGGVCEFTCSAGYMDCDMDPRNGCETDTSNNADREYFWTSNCDHTAPGTAMSYQCEHTTDSSCGADRCVNCDYLSGVIRRPGSSTGGLIKGGKDASCELMTEQYTGMPILSSVSEFGTRPAILYRCNFACRAPFICDDHDGMWANGCELAYGYWRGIEGNVINSAEWRRIYHGHAPDYRNPLLIERFDIGGSIFEKYYEGGVFGRHTRHEQLDAPGGTEVSEMVLGYNPRLDPTNGGVGYDDDNTDIRDRRLAQKDGVDSQFGPNNKIDFIDPGTIVDFNGSREQEHPQAFDCSFMFSTVKRWAVSKNTQGEDQVSKPRVIYKYAGWKPSDIGAGKPLPLADLLRDPTDPENDVAPGADSVAITWTLQTFADRYHIETFHPTVDGTVEGEKLIWGCDPKYETSQGGNAYANDAGTCNFVCKAGWKDCDLDPSNGCETNVNGPCTRYYHEPDYSVFTGSNAPARIDPIVDESVFRTGLANVVANDCQNWRILDFYRETVDTDIGCKFLGTADRACGLYDCTNCDTLSGAYNIPAVGSSCEESIGECEAAFEGDSNSLFVCNPNLCQNRNYYEENDVFERSPSRDFNPPGNPNLRDGCETAVSYPYGWFINYIKGKDAVNVEDDFFAVNEGNTNAFGMLNVNDPNLDYDVYYPGGRDGAIADNTKNDFTAVGEGIVTDELYTAGSQNPGNTMDWRGYIIDRQNYKLCSKQVATQSYVLPGGEVQVLRSFAPDEFCLELTRRPLVVETFADTTKNPNPEFFITGTTDANEAPQYDLFGNLVELTGPNPIPAANEANRYPYNVEFDCNNHIAPSGYDSIKQVYWTAPTTVEGPWFHVEQNPEYEFNKPHCHGGFEPGQNPQYEDCTTYDLAAAVDGGIYDLNKYDPYGYLRTSELNLKGGTNQNQYTKIAFPDPATFAGGASNWAVVDDTFQVFYQPKDILTNRVKGGKCSIECETEYNDADEIIAAWFDCDGNPLNGCEAKLVVDSTATTRFPLPNSRTVTVLASGNVEDSDSYHLFTNYPDPISCTDWTKSGSCGAGVGLNCVDLPGVANNIGNRDPLTTATKDPDTFFADAAPFYPYAARPTCVNKKAQYLLNNRKYNDINPYDVVDTASTPYVSNPSSNVDTGYRWGIYPGDYECDLKKGLACKTGFLGYTRVRGSASRNFLSCRMCVGSSDTTPRNSIDNVLHGTTISTNPSPYFGIRVCMDYDGDWVNGCETALGYNVAYQCTNSIPALTGSDVTTLNTILGTSYSDPAEADTAFHFEGKYYISVSTRGDSTVDIAQRGCDDWDRSVGVAPYYDNQFGHQAYLLRYYNDLNVASTSLIEEAADLFEANEHRPAGASTERLGDTVGAGNVPENNPLGVSDAFIGGLDLSAGVTVSRTGFNCDVLRFLPAAHTHIKLDNGRDPAVDCDQGVCAFKCTDSNVWADVDGNPWNGCESHVDLCSDSLFKGDYAELIGVVDPDTGVIDSPNGFAGCRATFGGSGSETPFDLVPFCDGGRLPPSGWFNWRFFDQTSVLPVDAPWLQEEYPTPPYTERHEYIGINGDPDAYGVPDFEFDGSGVINPTSFNDFLNADTENFVTSEFRITLRFDAGSDFTSNTGMYSQMLWAAIADPTTDLFAGQAKKKYSPYSIPGYWDNDLVDRSCYVAIPEGFGGAVSIPATPIGDALYPLVQEGTASGRCEYICNRYNGYSDCGDIDVDGNPCVEHTRRRVCGWNECISCATLPGTIITNSISASTCVADVSIASSGERLDGSVANPYCETDGTACNPIYCIDADNDWRNGCEAPQGYPSGVDTEIPWVYDPSNPTRPGLWNDFDCSWIANPQPNAEGHDFGGKSFAERYHILLDDTTPQGYCIGNDIQGKTGGTCEFECMAPWADRDGDPSNGCEWNTDLCSLNGEIAKGYPEYAQVGGLNCENLSGYSDGPDGGFVAGLSPKCDGEEGGTGRCYGYACRANDDYCDPGEFLDPSRDGGCVLITDQVDDMYCGVDWAWRDLERPELFFDLELDPEINQYLLDVNSNDFMDPLGQTVSVEAQNAGRGLDLTDSYHEGRGVLPDYSYPSVTNRCARCDTLGGYNSTFSYCKKDSRSNNNRFSIFDQQTPVDDLKKPWHKAWNADGTIQMFVTGNTIGDYLCELHGDYDTGSDGACNHELCVDEDYFWANGCETALGYDMKKVKGAFDYHFVAPDWNPLYDADINDDTVEVVRQYWSATTWYGPGAGLAASIYGGADFADAVFDSCRPYQGGPANGPRAIEQTYSPDINPAGNTPLYTTNDVIAPGTTLVSPVPVDTVWEVELVGGGSVYQQHGERWNYWQNGEINRGVWCPFLQFWSLATDDFATGECLYFPCPHLDLDLKVDQPNRWVTCINDAEDEMAGKCNYQCNLAAGWKDCDADPMTGCETNIFNDNSCGANCEKLACNKLPGVNPFYWEVCVAPGECELAHCDQDLCINANGIWQDGCELAQGYDGQEFYAEGVDYNGLTGVDCGALAALNTAQRAAVADPDVEVTEADFILHLHFNWIHGCNGEPGSYWAGMCEYECADGWVDCDGDITNGCEHDGTLCQDMGGEDACHGALGYTSDYMGPSNRWGNDAYAYGYRAVYDCRMLRHSFEHHFVADGFDPVCDAVRGSATAGRCIGWVCDADAGYFDCDGDPRNGCEHESLNEACGETGQCINCYSLSGTDYMEPNPLFIIADRLRAEPGDFDPRFSGYERSQVSTNYAPGANGAVWLKNSELPTGGDITDPNTARGAVANPIADTNLRAYDVLCNFESERYIRRNVNYWYGAANAANNVDDITKFRVADRAVAEYRQAPQTQGGPSPLIYQPHIGFLYNPCQVFTQYGGYTEGGPVFYLHSHFQTVYDYTPWYGVPAVIDSQTQAFRRLGCELSVGQNAEWKCELETVSEAANLDINIYCSNPDGQWESGYEAAHQYDFPYYDQVAPAGISVVGADQLGTPNCDSLNKCLPGDRASDACAVYGVCTGNNGDYFDCSAMLNGETDQPHLPSFKVVQDAALVGCDFPGQGGIDYERTTGYGCDGNAASTCLGLHITYTLQSSGEEYDFGVVYDDGSGCTQDIYASGDAFDSFAFSNEFSSGNAASLCYDELSSTGEQSMWTPAPGNFVPIGPDQVRGFCYYRCEKGWIDCDNDPRNGCETNVKLCRDDDFNVLNGCEVALQYEGETVDCADAYQTSIDATFSVCRSGNDFARRHWAATNPGAADTDNPYGPDLDAEGNVVEGGTCYFQCNPGYEECNGVVFGGLCDSEQGVTSCGCVDCTALPGIDTSGANTVECNAGVCEFSACVPGCSDVDPDAPGCETADGYNENNSPYTGSFRCDSFDDPAFADSVHVFWSPNPDTGLVNTPVAECGGSFVPGTCAITCQGGWFDCNGDPRDGCEDEGYYCRTGGDTSDEIFASPNRRCSLAMRYSCENGLSTLNVPCNRIVPDNFDNLPDTPFDCADMFNDPLDYQVELTAEVPVPYCVRDPNDQFFDEKAGDCRFDCMAGFQDCDDYAGVRPDYNIFFPGAAFEAGCESLITADTSCTDECIDCLTLHGISVEPADAATIACVQVDDGNGGTVGQCTYKCAAGCSDNDGDWKTGCETAVTSDRDLRGIFVAPNDRMNCAIMENEVKKNPELFTRHLHIDIRVPVPVGGTGGRTFIATATRPQVDYISLRPGSIRCNGGFFDDTQFRQGYCAFVCQVGWANTDGFSFNGCEHFVGDAANIPENDLQYIGYGYKRIGANADPLSAPSNTEPDWRRAGSGTDILGDGYTACEHPAFSL